MRIISPTNWTLSAIVDPAFLRKAVLIALVVGVISAVSILPVVYAAAVIGGTCALLLLLRWPELGLPLLIISIPYGNINSGAIGGFEFSLTEPLVFLVAAVWVARGISSGGKAERFKLRSAPLYIPLLIFLWIVIFSLTTAPALVSSAKEVLKWAAVIVTYALVVSTVQTRRHVALLLATTFIAAISESAIGFYQFVAKAGPKGFIIGSFLRAFGTFGQPNPYAGYLAIAAATAFGLILYSVMTWFRGRPKYVIPRSEDSTAPSERRDEESATSLESKSPGSRNLRSVQNDIGEARNGAAVRDDRVRLPLLLLGWAAFGACAIAIAMSMSRGAWLGLAIGLGAITALSSRRAFWIMVVALVILGLFVFTFWGLGLTQLLPAQMVARVTEAVDYFGIFDVTKVELTPENWPIVERMAHWQAAWDMYVDHPLFGVGIGNYADAYPDYYVANWKDPMGHAHNLYLNMLAEMGLVGLTGYLLLVASFFLHGFRTLKRLTRSTGHLFERYVLVGLLGALVAVSVHNLLDNLLVHGVGVQVGIMLGLITVLDHLGRQHVAASVQEGG